MNLHDLARGAINTVNADRQVAWLQSVGQNIGDDYVQRPAYAPCVIVAAQIQPVSDKALQWLAQSRQNTVWRDLYVYGAVCGLDRTVAKGGDLFYFDNAEWLVDQALEDWSAEGWSKARVCKQRETHAPAAGATTPPPEFYPGVDAPMPLEDGHV